MVLCIEICCEEKESLCQIEAQAEIDTQIMNKIEDLEQAYGFSTLTPEISSL